MRRSRRRGEGPLPLRYPNLGEAHGGAGLRVVSWQTCCWGAEELLTRSARTRMMTVRWLTRRGKVVGRSPSLARDNLYRHVKTLAPPKMDVEMSLLCQGDWDEGDVHLVGLTIQFLLEESRRTTFYTASPSTHDPDFIMTTPHLRQAWKVLREEQKDSSKRIKQLVQHTLCLVWAT